MQRSHLAIAVSIAALSTSLACAKTVVDDGGTSYGIGTSGIPTTGDGDPTTTSTGDGDGDSGDGDGDPTTTTTTTTGDGDGDGDPTTTTTTTTTGDGDGDGDPTTTTTTDDPIPACGWDAQNMYYECGFEGADPGGTPLACPDGLVDGAPCDDTGLTGSGCCDADGNLWYCTVDQTAFFSPC